MLPTFDKGGYLPSGVSTVYNGTGKPKPILTASQWADIKAAGGVGGSRPGHTINVNDRFGQPEQVAREVLRRMAFAEVS